MKKKFLLIFILLVLLNVLIFLGIPYLKTIREERGIGSRIVISSGNTSFQRTVTVDITIESICRNMISDELYTKCQDSASCENTCIKEGCEFFGLNYQSFRYEDRKCYCECLETNKIKKALSGQ